MYGEDYKKVANILTNKTVVNKWNNTILFFEKIKSYTLVWNIYFWVISK